MITRRVYHIVVEEPMKHDLTLMRQEAEEHLKSIRAEKRQINKQLQAIRLEEKRLDSLLQQTIHP